MPLSRYLLAVLLLCPLALCAKELKCSHKGSEEFWINKISIDTAHQESHSRCRPVSSIRRHHRGRAHLRR